MHSVLNKLIDSTRASIWTGCPCFFFFFNKWQCFTVIFRHYRRSCIMLLNIHINHYLIFFFNLRKISQVLVIRVHVLWYFIVRKDEEEEEKGKGKEKEGRLLLGNGEEEGNWGNTLKSSSNKVRHSGVMHIKNGFPLEEKISNATNRLACGLVWLPLS